jgi:hypothetical protein
MKLDDKIKSVDLVGEVFHDPWEGARELFLDPPVDGRYAVDWHELFDHFEGQRVRLRIEPA